MRLRGILISVITLSSLIVMTACGDDDVKPTTDMAIDLVSDMPTDQEIDTAIEMGIDQGVDQVDVDQGADLKPDLPAGTGGKCATPIGVTLDNGEAHIEGDTSKQTDEYSDLKCEGQSGYTGTLDAPQLYYALQGKKDQWYRFVLSPEFTSAYMYLFTGYCSEAIIANDCQSAGFSGASSRLAADEGEPTVMYYKATSNNMFKVAVDSTYYDGKFALDVAEIDAPTNTTCANATSLGFFNGKAVVNGDTYSGFSPDEFATLECDSTRVDGPQVYYKFEAKAGESYRIKLINRAGGYLYGYVFGDSCVEADIATDCSSLGVTGLIFGSVGAGDAGATVFTPTADGTYHIAIDGDDSYDYGQFTLEIDGYELPTNGTCATAEAITFTNGKWSTRGSTLGLKDEHSDVDCDGYYDYDGPQAYYKLTVEDTKGYRLKLDPQYRGYWYVFQAANCSNVDEINNNCDSGGSYGNNFESFYYGSSYEEVFRPDVAGDYIIAIDSAGEGYQGDFNLEIEEIDAPQNETACNATPLQLTNGEVVVKASTATARNEFGTTSTTGIVCDGSYVFAAPQVYYELAMDASKAYKITYNPTFGSAYLYVFQKTSCNNAKQINIDCASGTIGAKLGSVSAGYSETLNFVPTQSGTYVIGVDSRYASGSGDFSLSVKEIEKPTNETCATAEAISLTNNEVTIISTTDYAHNEYTNLQCSVGSSVSSVLSGPQLYWSMDMSVGKIYAITAATNFSSGYFYLFDGSKACSEANIASDCQSDGTSGLTIGPISSGEKYAYFKPTKSGNYKMAFDSTSSTGDVGFRIEEFTPDMHSTCAKAKVFSIINNEAKLTGHTVDSSDEFSGAIKCGGSAAFAAGQMYFRTTLKSGVEYNFLVTSNFDPEVYIFPGTSGCDKNLIESYCSAGSTNGTHVSGSNGLTSIIFSPPADGVYFIAIDGKTATDIGSFDMDVKAFILPTLVAPFKEDFETSNGSLAARGDWQYGKLQWDGSACEGYADYPPNDQGHDLTQSYMWGTILNDCYTNAGNNQGSATSGCISTNKTDDSVLAFKVDLSQPTCATATKITLSMWNYVSGPNGSDAAIVYINDTVDTANTYCSSSSNGWNEQTIDLSQYAGETPRVALHWYASSIVNDSGWYVDEISVTCQ